MKTASLMPANTLQPKSRQALAVIDIAADRSLKKDMAFSLEGSERQR